MAKIIETPSPGPSFVFPPPGLKPPLIMQSRDEQSRAICSFSSEILPKLQEITSPGKSVFFSPLSIHEALALASSGSAGQTLEAFIRLLHIPTGKTPLDFQAILTMGKQMENTIQVFNVSNSLWIDQRFPIYKDFLDRCKLGFDANANVLDFQSPSAPKSINDWIKEKTEGKITKVIESLKRDERLILVNTVYFKQPWKEPFKEFQTKDDKFTKTDGKEVQCKMMNISHGFGYVTSDDAIFVSMPFKDQNCQMLIILPNEKGDGSLLNVAKKYLEANEFKGVVEGITHRKLNLSLPRIKAKFSTSLKNTLINMGLANPFSEDADFSLISPEKLFISDVIHEAILDINEHGVEAAAVTVVRMNLMMGMVSREPPPIPVRIDRPAVVVLYLKSTKLVAFVGLIKDVE